MLSYLLSIWLAAWWRGYALMVSSQQDYSICASLLFFRQLSIISITLKETGSKRELPCLLRREGMSSQRYQGWCLLMESKSPPLSNSLVLTPSSTFSSGVEDHPDWSAMVCPCKFKSPLVPRPDGVDIFCEHPSCPEQYCNPSSPSSFLAHTRFTQGWCARLNTLRVGIV